MLGRRFARSALSTYPARFGKAFAALQRHDTIDYNGYIGPAVAGLNYETRGLSCWIRTKASKNSSKRTRSCGDVLRYWKLPTPTTTEWRRHCGSAKVAIVRWRNRRGISSSFWIGRERFSTPIKRPRGASASLRATSWASGKWTCFRRKWPGPKSRRSDGSLPPAK